MLKSLIAVFEPVLLVRSVMPCEPIVLTPSTLLSVTGRQAAIERGLASRTAGWIPGVVLHAYAVVVITLSTRNRQAAEHSFHMSLKSAFDFLMGLAGSNVCLKLSAPRL